jgi:phosphonopyruvate decarboxylase
MIEAKNFVEQARELGWQTWTGVPCSYLSPFINHVMTDASLGYVPASNEGDAVAIAAGAELGGRRAVVMFQNSGLGNAVNPLTSLAHTHQIPMLLIVTHRGQPGGPPDEPQHGLMGRITTDMLDTMDIRWEPFPRTAEEIRPCLLRAKAYQDERRLPYALVMPKDAVAPVPQPPALPAQALATEMLPSRATKPQPFSSRRDYLSALQNLVGPRDLVVATTGYTGRELYALADRSNQFYLVGAMGCASSVGLGLALARPDWRVIVLDGDGAALMRLGALPTIAYLRPPNLIHVVLDNRMHESTGGQSTVSASVDFAGIAAACGYPKVRRCHSAHELSAIFAEQLNALTFVHAKMSPGISAALPRPAVSPQDVAQRLRSWIQNSRSEL